MKTKILISLMLLTFAASSCAECRNIKSYKLTEAEKQMIPYELGQTVNFINSMGQPFVLTVGRNTIYTWQNDECWSFEIQSVHLMSELGDAEIRLTISGEYNQISIYIFGFGYGLGYDEDGTFKTYTPFPDAEQFFHESIEINGKVFYDVVEQNNSSNGTQLFYNKTYGILQVNKDGENFLTINPKTDGDKENKNLDVIDCPAVADFK